MIWYDMIWYDMIWYVWIFLTQIIMAVWWHWLCNDMFTAIPIETSAEEAHSVYFRQFPFGNKLNYIPTQLISMHVSKKSKKSIYIAHRQETSNAQHSQQRGHYVSTLSVLLSVRLVVRPVLTSAATLSVGQHAGESIHEPTWTWWTRPPASLLYRRRHQTNDRGRSSAL